MAKVKIEKIVDHLDTKLRKALEATISEHFPNQSFDASDIFRTFKRMVSRKCNAWENVPDSYIKKRITNPSNKSNS